MPSRGSEDCATVAESLGCWTIRLFAIFRFGLSFAEVVDSLDAAVGNEAAKRKLDNPKRAACEKFLMAAAAEINLE
jgi:hypothetical protein